ncbi:hypothetical protein ACFCZ3_05650 [Cellulosimicrobium cellulans]|uniref:hypothetical protein n=1 Tax=Cellulosimicrobium cellulans TaxID=1710 RepID=UPI0035D98822
MNEAPDSAVTPRAIPQDRLLGDVRQWLEKGGYALEMRVALSLRKRTNLLAQGYTYKDPATGLEREADVWGAILVNSKDPLHSIDIFIECKQTDAPWIGFKSHGGLNGPISFWDYYDDECAVCSGVEHSLHAFLAPIPEAYAITEKRSREKQGRQGSRDLAYEAVQQAANAFLASRVDIDEIQGHPADSRVVSGPTLAIVVTTSPIVVASLDGGGELVLEETDSLKVLVPRQGLGDSEGVEVLVVNLDALEATLDALATLGARQPRD